MKITTFNTQIITNHSQEITEFFEQIGFEKNHVKNDVGRNKVTGICLKNPDGFKIDISDPKIPLPQDVTSIRINVDDFKEAYDMFIDRGFENYYGNDTAVTSSSQSAVLMSPSGLFINLVKHIK